MTIKGYLAKMKGARADREQRQFEKAQIEIKEARARKERLDVIAEAKKVKEENRRQARDLNPIVRGLKTMKEERSKERPPRIVRPLKGGIYEEGFKKKSDPKGDLWRLK